MEKDHLKEQRYKKAQKRIKDIKGFYAHFSIYIIVNLFISGLIIYGESNDDIDVTIFPVTIFGVYSTWLFWGIGVFFHWLGVFGFKNILGKSWEDKKIKELMEEENKLKRN